MVTYVGNETDDRESIYAFLLLWKIYRIEVSPIISIDNKLYNSASSANLSGIWINNLRYLL